MAIPLEFTDSIHRLGEALICRYEDPNESDIGHKYTVLGGGLIMRRIMTLSLVSLPLVDV